MTSWPVTGSSTTRSPRRVLTWSVSLALGFPIFFMSPIFSSRPAYVGHFGFPWDLSQCRGYASVGESPARVAPHFLLDLLAPFRSFGSLVRDFVH